MKSERVCGVFGFICVVFLLFVFGLFVDNDLVFASSQTAAKQLTDASNIVSSGDGLYVDSYEPGRYVYKGGNPNNFIEFNDELWRIVAVEGDGGLKIVRSESIGSYQFDSVQNRYSSDPNAFCRIEISGCSIWGSATTTLDSNENNISKMVGFDGVTLYNLPEKESSLNVFLNDEYFQNINEQKTLVVSDVHNIGTVDDISNPGDMETLLYLEEQNK